MAALRSTFSLAVADRLAMGASITDALTTVLGGIQDGSGPRTSDVLADLQDMGVWHPSAGQSNDRRECFAGLGKGLNE